MFGTSNSSNKVKSVLVEVAFNVAPLNVCTDAML